MYCLTNYYNNLNNKYNINYYDDFNIYYLNDFRKNNKKIIKSMMKIKYTGVNMFLDLKKSKYAYKRNMVYSFNSYHLAIKYNNMKSFKYICKKFGYDPYIYTCAIYYNNLSCLKYAHKHKCPYYCNKEGIYDKPMFNTYETSKEIIDYIRDEM